MEDNNIKDREVSCRVAGMLFQELKKTGNLPEKLAAGTDYTVTHLQNKHERLSWAGFTALMANARQVWCEEELVQIGYRFVLSPWAKPFALIARMLVSPVDLYRYTTESRTGASSHLFTNITSSMVQLVPDQLEVTFLMYPGYEPSWELALITKGLMQGLPNLLGVGDAVVSMTYMERGVSYQVHPPADTSRRAKIRQFVRRPFVLRAAAQELKEANQQLILRYQELETQLARQKEIEEALRQSEKQYRDLLETMHEGFHVLDEKGVFVYVNTRFAEMMGYLSSQLIGQKSYEFIQFDEPNRELMAKQGDLRKQGISSTYELSLTRPDKKKLIVLVSARPIPDENGQYKGSMVVTTDITDYKQAEAALQHAQKMESLGVLAGGVAHDFNNLLVAMLGQTSIAAAKLPPDHAARQHLDKAVKATKRASDLTRQMLAYSGRGSFELQQVHLNDLLEENLHLLAATLPKNIHFVPQLAEKLTPIEGDVGQIQQVVMNLIINAAEAIGSHSGTVSLRTGLQRIAGTDAELWQHTGQQLTPGLYVTLEVKDDGAGMDQETLSRIFDPFFTTKFTGRGLGLAAVLGIMRGHNGGLQVTSQPDRGTTFLLLFPALTQSDMNIVVQPEPISETRCEVAQHPYLVLVIDDEPKVLEAVTDILDMEGIEVLTAVDGQTGIQLYQQHQADIGLVLLDLSMPGLSGVETFKHLQQVNPEVNVLLSSGFSATEVIYQFEGQKPAGFIQKPYTIEALIEAVQQYGRLI